MKSHLNQVSRWVLAISVLVFAGCAKDHVTGKSTYNWYKLDKEVSLGKQVLAAQSNAFQKKNVQVDTDVEQLDRLKTIVERVGKVSHMPNLPYEIHLAEVPVPNAWAAPGGKMMVYSGLWDPKKGLVDKNNDDEIAAVLSHEMAHSTARHVTETLSRNMTLLLAGTVASTAIGAAGSQMGSNLFGQFFSYGFNIFAPTYSRKNEYEADRIGLFYMAKAGYDPRAAIRVWKRAAKKKGDMTTIYASHPASGERAKTLERYLPMAIAIYENPEKPFPNFAELTKFKKNKEKQKEAKIPEKEIAKVPEKNEAKVPEKKADKTPKKKENKAPDKPVLQRL